MYLKLSQGLLYPVFLKNMRITVPKCETSWVHLVIWNRKAVNSNIVADRKYVFWGDSYIIYNIFGGKRK